MQNLRRSFPRARARGCRTALEAVRQLHGGRRADPRRQRRAQPRHHPWRQHPPRDGAAGPAGPLPCRGADGGHLGAGAGVRVEGPRPYRSGPARRSGAGEGRSDRGHHRHARHPAGLEGRPARWPGRRCRARPQAAAAGASGAGIRLRRDQRLRGRHAGRGLRLAGSTRRTRWRAASRWSEIGGRRRRRRQRASRSPSRAS